jgi:flavin reductase (DIM6/NTAB) family NADH-FMN oxidoreductase RutF
MKEITKNEAITLSSPLPFALISVTDKNGSPNAIGVSWVSICSWDPWLFALSIAPERHSHQSIEDTGEFVINYPSESLAESAWKCSTQSGRKIDKFKEFGLQSLPSLKVKPPCIKGSTVCIECRVVDRMTTGDHTLFVGEALASSGDIDQLRHLYCIHYTKLISIDHEGNADFNLSYK